MQPFSSHFCKKIKMYKKKKKKKPTRGSVVMETVPFLWGVEVDTFRHISSPASCSGGTLPPPALWVSNLNTPNLQAECTSLKLVYSKPEDFL